MVGRGRDTLKRSFLYSTGPPPVISGLEHMRLVANLKTIHNLFSRILEFNLAIQWQSDHAIRSLHRSSSIPLLPLRFQYRNPGTSFLGYLLPFRGFLCT